MTATSDQAPSGADTPPEPRRFHMVLVNDLAELGAVAEAVETLADELDWNPAAAMHIDLVLEELLTNTINYGYPEGRAGQIDIWVDATPATIQLRIEDDAIPFDPFAAPPPDLSLSIEERPIGGLGIHFVRTYMNEWGYEYTDDRNRITLLKRL